MKKILIIEDDKSLQKELYTLLINSGYEAEIVTVFEKVVSQITGTDADLVLLDIKIPGMTGDFILREVRKTSQIPVIMVTSKNSDMDEVLCMSYGADDYITKPYHPALLLLHIEAVLKRTGETSGQMQAYRGLQICPAKSCLVQGEEEILLSKNEFGIFSYLLEHVGEIVTREEIMSYLWDNEKFVDDNTLTVNITRLRKKLEEAGLHEVIETRRGQGYILL